MPISTKKKKEHTSDREILREKERENDYDSSSYKYRDNYDAA